MGKQVNGALTKLEQVKHWFYAGKLPYWTLYRGQPQPKGTTEATIAKNIDFEDMDEAWDLLQSMLGNFENGIFTILAKPKPESSSGLNRITFSPGLVDEAIPVQGIAGMQQMGIGSINSIIEKEKTLWELQRKVEDLEASREVKETIGDKIFGMLESNMPLLLENVIPMLIQKFFPTPIPGTIAGIAQPQTEDVENEIIQDALNRIAIHFKLSEALPKLADFVEANPDMAKSFLK